ncbi:MAG: CPBP family intramembrane metalloprotease [Oligoflexales bacterium]|nr:CPBP family intramembrane metalloprotease [Oligoflexales bacterium]
MNQFTLKHYVRLCLFSLLLVICFSYLYLKISDLFEHPWFGIAVVNTVLASFVVLLLIIKNTASIQLTSKKMNSLWYAPSIAVLILAVILQIAVYSWNEINWTINIEQAAFIFWIPLIEELIFRSGIANALIKFSTPVLGHFFAALIFALVHNFSVLESFNIAELFNLPLGAFLLGICCSYLYCMAKDIRPAILFHMACNATVVILGSNGAIWLKRFHFLYQ